MTAIVSMWSGPRNISTTMMRSFGARSDMAVLDEPFYAAFLAATGAAHPYRDETLAAYPNTQHDVIDWLNEERSKPYLFAKNIAYHFEGWDLSFAEGHRNFILIRDPRAMVASFAVKMSDAAPITASYAVARALREHLTANGISCPVVDSSDILAAPEAMLRQLCAALDLEFEPAMLSWPPGPRDEDGPWAPHWYDAVLASTGFNKPVEKPVALTPAQESIAAAAASDYALLHQVRIAPPISMR